MTTLFKYVQVQDFALAGAGAVAGATTIQLKSFKTIDGVLLTMNDFGLIGFGTLEPGNGIQEEQISFTGVTQNANGTADLTGVSNVLFVNPYTATSGTAKTHAGSTPFIISNTAGFYNKFGAKANDEIITGYWEAPDPLTPQGLVTNAYMLALINGGAVSVNRIVELGIAGENLVAGDLIYFSETDNEWRKTAGATLTTLFNVKLGIAQGVGSDGVTITGGVLTRGSYTTAGLVQGDLCYASNTAGGINSGTAGTVPRVIGIAKDTTTLYFDPDFQNELYDYAVDAVGTDSYAITLPGALSVAFVGMVVRFKAGTANTGACTLAINGGGAIAIKKNVSVALDTGDILASQIIEVVYDGTNFQLISRNTANAATDAEYNAGTQLGGAGQPLFVNPLSAPGKFTMGVLGSTVAKTYFTTHMPFTLWTGTAAGGATTDFPNWVRDSTEVFVAQNAEMVDFRGTGGHYLVTSTDNTTTPFLKGASTYLEFDDTNIIVFECFAKLATGQAGDMQFGFGTENGDFTCVYNNDGVAGRVTFALSNATLYATIADDGVGVTNTDITSGITLTNWNNYRIELHLGTDAKFYVNGVLKATLSGSNFFVGSEPVNIGFGRSGTSLFQATAPNIALQLI